MRNLYKHKKISLLCLLAAFFGIVFSARVQAQDLITKDRLQTALADLSGQEGPSAQTVQSAVDTGLAALSGTALLQLIKNGFQKGFSAQFFPLSLLVAVVFLNAVTELFSEHLGNGTHLADKAFLLVGILTVLEMFVPLLQAVQAFLKEYLAFMTAGETAAGFLLSLSGNVTAATFSAASCGFTVNLIQMISIYGILPCVRFLLALGVVGTLGAKPDFSGIFNVVKGMCTWGLGALFAVFGGVHAAGVHLAGTADSLALRGLRFSAARLIPVAGNMLSESLRTVLTGMQMIRSSYGILGIAYLLYLVMPTLILILCVKLCLLLVTFLSRLLGCVSLTSFFVTFGSVLNILSAICLFASVSGIVIWAVFIRIQGGV